MEKNKQKIDHELEMEKILDRNQLDNADIKTPIDEKLGIGLEQKKVFYKDKGFLSKIGLYGGFGNYSTKRRFTILALIAIIIIIASTTVYRRTHPLYSEDLYSTTTIDRELSAGNMSVVFESKYRFLNDDSDITAVWYDQDKETILCEGEVAFGYINVLNKTAHSSCIYSSWETGRYTIDFEENGEVFQTISFQVGD